MKNWFNKKYGWFFTNGNKKDPYYPPIDGMDAVAIALNDAKQVGLDTEVVTWALMYMKNNPNLTISEAITMGYFEWVK
jgi:hypothetical protein